MSWTTKNNIREAVAAINQTQSDIADIKHRTRMIMYRFLSEVEAVAERKNLTKRDLAEMIGTSPSYITQLFRGHKLVNLETLAKFEKGLGIKFKIKIDNNFNDWISDNFEFQDIFLNKYHSKDGFWAFHKKASLNYEELNTERELINAAKPEEKFLKLVG